LKLQRDYLVLFPAITSPESINKPQETHQDEEEGDVSENILREAMQRTEREEAKQQSNSQREWSLVVCVFIRSISTR